jgi:hypothetical protein
VTLSNELHQELDTTDKITVHYGADNHAAETPAASASTGVSSGVVITLGLVVVSVLAILGVGFALTRGKRDA